MRFKTLFYIIVSVGVSIGFGVFALPSIQYFNTNIQFRKAVVDVTSSTGSSGQLLQSTGTSTIWVSTSTLGLAGAGSPSGDIFIDNLTAKTPDGSGFVTSTHNLNISRPLVQLWNGNIMVNNNIYPPDGVYSYIQIVDANTLRIDYQSIATAIGANLSTLYLVVGGGGPQGPAGPGVSTSTANYFTYYNGSSSVTGTPDVQLSNGLLINTTTTITPRLNITGDLAISSGIYDSNNTLGSYGQVLQTNGTVASWVNTSSLGFSTIGSGLAGQIPYYATAGTGLTATSAIFIDSNSKVGINTNSPQAIFDVRDFTPTSTGAIFKVANSAGSLPYMFVSSTATTIRGTSGAVNFELGVSTDNGSQVLIHGDNAAISSDANKALVVNGRGNLYLQSGGANRMFISSAGLVGVNTVVPQTLFMIQGRANEDPFSVVSSTSASMLRVLTNGNIGVNSSSPKYTLGVEGYIGANRVYTGNPNVYLGADALGIVVTGGYLYAQGSGNSFYSQNNAVFRGGLSNDSATYLTINGGTASTTYINGKLGINSTTPFGKLSIKGFGTSSSSTIFITDSLGRGIFKLFDNGHLSTTSTRPSLSSCGTSPAINGTDSDGEITAGATASSCTLTFAKTYANAPTCVVSFQTALATEAYTITSSTLVVSATSLGGTKVNYSCKGIDE